MNSPPDLVIIGAGAAGLTAAHELSNSGMRVLLLEARDRIGGRILTHHTPNYPVELGAEFIHGRPPETFDLVNKTGLRVAEMTWKLARRKGNQWVEDDPIMEDVDKLFSKMSTDEPDQSFQKFLDHVEADPEIKQQGLRFVEGFHAADPRRISVHSLVRSNQAEEKVDGNRQFRFGDGYDSLVKSISTATDRKLCELQMNTAVTAIDWQKGKVKLKTAAGNEFQASRALLTVPLSLLKAGKISFHPGLREKERALQRLEMGPVIRVSLGFRSRFWEEKEPLRGVSFVFSDEPHFPTWWTSNPLPFPILTGWAAGRYATALAGLTEEQRVNRALESLAGILDTDVERLRGELQQGLSHDWQADPFSCGAYSYSAVGGADAGHELETPVSETLFFSGEATESRGDNGTVHGAIASGKRVSKEILRVSH
ncbi:MAG TPA: NAD(P)/FAD-dependent oxidoreductase [Candidatus Angelobacter sp.]